MFAVLEVTYNSVEGINYDCLYSFRTLKDAQAYSEKRIERFFNWCMQYYCSDFNDPDFIKEFNETTTIKRDDDGMYLAVYPEGDHDWCECIIKELKSFEEA